jgi:hypothetical protein
LEVYVLEIKKVWSSLKKPENVGEVDRKDEKQ